jgi:RNA polymerase primary sigma factor
MEPMIEDEFKPAFMEWKQNPTPEGNASFLKAIDPVIQRGVKMYGGDSPLAASRGKLIALEAAQKYDPTRSKLQTHIIGHMQGLRRINRQQSQVIAVPEQLLQDRARLDQYTQELADEMGRDPTDDELSDRLGFSQKRLQKIRSYQPGMTTGQVSQSNPQTETASRLPGQDEAARLWVEIVRQDLNTTDKYILESSLGMNGKPVLANEQIAAKLGLTPGAISQRKLRIQQLLDKEPQLSPFAQR